MRKMIDIDFGSTRYDELVELRYKILLEPLGLKFLDSHRVQEANYLHIGCIECLDDKLVGGLMLVPVDNDTIRMMQVAVDTKYQGEGIGRDLVRYAEKRARAAGYHKIVMHAMLTVVHFYEKNGYRQEGEIFEAVDFEIEKSGYKNLLQAGLVITGGSAQMLNICQLASTVTGLEARVAYPDESIVSDSISEVYSPAQATAVGLVLKGFEKMAREKTVYNTATPIKYDIFADSQQEEELATVEVAENEKKEKESEKVQKVSFWERLKGSLNTDKMFNPDNQA